MENKTLISVIIFILLVIGIWFMYSASPTKAEVERYFEENKCVYCSGEQYGEVYYLRRNTGMLFGQIFSVPWFVTPKLILYTTTPFNYYYDINHREDEVHTYTWVDTRDGRFVYNAINGEYVKEIDNKKDPAKKYFEDMDTKVDELKKSSEN